MPRYKIGTGYGDECASLDGHIDEKEGRLKLRKAGSFYKYIKKLD